VKNPTLCAAVFALAAAVPVGAQTTDEALPPPEVSERAKQLLDADKDATKKKPRSFLIMPQAMSGTIRGERDADEAGLTVELEGMRALPVKGNLIGLLRELWERGELPREVRLLACGPERMLEAVEELARENGLAAWLSLETLMGCGVGICNGCPVPTRPEGPLGDWPNAKCCVEGPVFSADAITLSHA